jgi:transposase-like protein
MKRYSAERRESVIQKMMPPHNIPIPRLAEETGISDVALYTCRKQARVEGGAVPPDPSLVSKNSTQVMGECPVLLQLRSSLNSQERQLTTRYLPFSQP